MCWPESWLGEDAVVVVLLPSTSLSVDGRRGGTAGSSFGTGGSAGDGLLCGEIVCGEVDRLVAPRECFAGGASVSAGTRTALRLTCWPSARRLGDEGVVDSPDGKGSIRNDDGLTLDASPLAGLRECAVLTTKLL